MPRFFVPKEQIADGVVTLLGDDAHHLSRSLRMAVGEKITVCDMQALQYECELTDFLPDRVLARVLSTLRCESEPPFEATVFQALPKGDKLDSVIQKAVECGACAIVPFESERCVVRAKDASEPKKLERRRRIAAEAAKQSGRGVLPTVASTLSFREALARAAEADLALFCYEDEDETTLAQHLKAARQRLDLSKTPRISVMVGSEGGFSKAEAEAAVAAGLVSVGLGKRILRTETASSFVLSCLVYEFELSRQ